jgi:hypothetical protein
MATGSIMVPRAATSTKIRPTDRGAARLWIWSHDGRLGAGLPEQLGWRTGFVTRLQRPLYRTRFVGDATFLTGRVTKSRRPRAATLVSSRSTK